MAGLERLAVGLYGYYAHDENEGWYCQIIDRDGEEIEVTQCFTDIGVCKTVAKSAARAINRE